MGDNQWCISNNMLTYKVKVNNFDAGHLENVLCIKGFHSNGSVGCLSVWLPSSSHLRGLHLLPFSPGYTNRTDWPLQAALG